MPGTFEALGVLVLAIVPGYLARSAWSRGKTFSRSTSDLTLVVQSIALSLVIQAALSPITFWLFYDVRDHLDEHPRRLAFWVVVGFVLVPLIGGYLTGKASDRVARAVGGQPDGWWRREARRLFLPEFPSIFDQVVVDDLPDPSILVVEFADGHRVAGSYAKGASIITSPQRQGLRLLQEWDVDREGVPTVSQPTSAGIMIVGLEDVRTIHIYAPNAPAPAPTAE
ncbi:MAG TPA: DUF6338 family protein [Candidatus Angelobacter sp.]|nr:DUF6338 family protein [Candidatus Angelobacter sp.]